MYHRLVRSLHRLLFEYDCVVVPQLGAFISASVPAEVDTLRSIASPPRVVLRFNDALQHHDGLLLSLYSRDLGLSQRRAKLEIERDVQSLRSELLRLGQLELEGIGQLRVSSEGRILFSSKPSSMLMHAFYGLPSVTLSSDKYEAKPSKYTELQNIASREADYLHLRIPKQVLRYAAVVVLFVVVIGLPFAFLQLPSPTYQASFVPDSVAVAQITEAISPSAKSEQPKQQKVEASPSNLWIEAEPGQHYVIIGTERNRARAERYIELYQKDYSNLRIVESKGTYRISVASFASIEEANVCRREVAESGLGAWVYSKK